MPPEPEDEYDDLRFADSRATRHLCIGTYLDDDFQCRVLDEVYNEPRRAIAPAAGADAALVILHAKQARILSISQYALLLGIVVTFGFIDFVATLSALVILIVWQLAAGVITVGSAMAGPPDAGGNLRTVVKLAVLGVVFFVVMQLGGLALITSVISAPEPDTALIFVVVLPLIAVVAGFAVMRDNRIRKLRDGVSDTGLDDDEVIEFIRHAQYGDVVNYSGYMPFIGHGRELLTWQFALPLYPNENYPDRDIAAKGPGFTVAKLIDALSSELRKYTKDSPGFRGLPNLVVSDVAFVSGIDTREPVNFVEDLAESDLPNDMRDIKSNPTLPVRHYLKCQINAWDGELVTTIFVTAAIQGETLYLEFVSRMLPPTKESYHVAEDRYPDDDFRLGALAELGRLPLLVLSSPLVLGRHLRDALRAAVRTSRSAQDAGAAEDSGALVSVRELGADFNFHGYFQERDAVKYTSILQTQILEHALNFLEKYIDVSELRQRKETIVNNTVINQGTVNTASQTGPGFVGSQSASSPKGRK